MKKHIVLVGAGAVGGFVGGHLARLGEDVTLVDPWAEHIDYMRAHGIHLSGSLGDHVVPVRAYHISDVQSLVRRPIDIAVICSKSFDTEWSTQLIAPYLSPQGYVVSMQNGVNEDRIARIVGASRTMGCIISTISVNCYQAGHVKRWQEAGGDKRVVFRVGEMHGRVTKRVTELAAILNQVDTARVTNDLWGEHWTKLTANVLNHGVLGAIGMDNRVIYVENGKPHRVAVRLAGEAIRIGWAQGYLIGTVLGMAPETWVAASDGKPDAVKAVQDGLAKWMSTLLEPSQSSVGRDISRGRRSEIEFTNGLVVEKGDEYGVPAPTHKALTDVVLRIDRGELAPGPQNLDAISV